MENSESEYVEEVWSTLRESINDFKEVVIEALEGRDYHQFNTITAFSLLKQMQASVREDEFFTGDRKTQTQLWALQMESELRRIYKGSYDRLYGSAS